MAQTDVETMYRLTVEAMRPHPKAGQRNAEVNYTTTYPLREAVNTLAVELTAAEWLVLKRYVFAGWGGALAAAGYLVDPDGSGR